MKFKPMLAQSPDTGKHPLRFPFLASPKLDGIRCIITPEGPRTRSLKPIPNKRLAAALSDPRLIGLDGELVAGQPNRPNVMQETTSAVMGVDADSSAVLFWVFDCVDCFDSPSLPFRMRLMSARRLVERFAAPDLVRFVEHERVECVDTLTAYEQKAVAHGYEGAMIRAPLAPYKFNRATAKEQGLLKLKRFEDMEGRVVDVFQRYTNENELEADERGYAKRSTSKAGLVPVDELGGVVVELGEGWKAETVRVGNGWTQEERRNLWLDPESLIGKLCKFKFQREGSKDAPRLPVFIAWRDPRDT